MELDKFNNTNCIELTEISTFKIDSEIFERMKNKIIDTFKQLDISTEGMSIYYERHNNGLSIMAIK